MTTATFSLATFAPAFPEIALLILASALLVVDLFVEARDRATTYWLAQASLLVAAIVTAGQLGNPSVVTLHGLYVTDYLAQVLKIATLVTVMAGLAMSRSYLEARSLMT